MGSGRIRSAAFIALVGLMTVACSDEEPAGAGGGDGQSEEPTAATVAIEDTELGQIVVDAEGRTLYVFLVDEGTDSTCYDDCEANWPPLTVEGDPVAGEGVDGSLLGTTEREDGSTQVTLDGHPLYRFAADETPDDMNGQGIGEVWFVVSPGGEAIKGVGAVASAYRS
ncbi:MAG: COG4315 family predicted lipoprotein [Actinomycetota bacterium]